MAENSTTQKRSLLERWKETAVAITAILGLVFLVFPALKPKEPEKKEAEKPVTQLAPSGGIQPPPVTTVSSGSSAGAEPAPENSTTPAPPSSSIEDEIKAVYNDMDRAMERKGFDAYVARMANDVEFYENGSADGVHMTKAQMRQWIEGAMKEFEMSGGAIKIQKVERAIHQILPQSDGSVIVQSTTQVTVRSNMNGLDKDETNRTACIDAWAKQSGRWLIIATKQSN